MTRPRFPIFAKLLEDNKINITFLYNNITFKVYRKQYNFIRSYDEILSLTLQKIKSSIISQIINSKATLAERSPLEIQIYYKNSQNATIDLENITVGEAFKIKGSEIIIEDCNYEIIYNPPFIKTFKLSKEPMANCPVIPFVEGNRANIEYLFKWLKFKTHTVEQTNDKYMDFDDYDRNKWHEISDSKFYTPTSEEINKNIALVCIPWLNSVRGPSEILVSNNIKPEPKYDIIKDRHVHTSSILEYSKIRLCSYNMLADLYAKSEYSKTVLFPYCPKAYLNCEYRKNILYREIMGYNADIICLQEVDQKLFNQHLLPGFNSSGYEGYLKCKSDTVVEGCSTFFRTSKFELVSNHDIEIPNAIQESPFYTQIATNPVLRENVLGKKAICQILVLKSKNADGKYLCVCNTHLYFLPTAPHVRLIQLASILAHLERILFENFTSRDKPTPVVLFCGDFNSSPATDVYKLMVGGSLDEGALSWPKDDSPEAFGGLKICHKLNFYSACGEPEYTNFVPGFQKCIDYIFAPKDKVKTLQVVPFPSRKQIEPYIALPNEELGSDHMALVCDINLL